MMRKSESSPREKLHVKRGRFMRKSAKNMNSRDPELEALIRMRDEDIDTADIPEVADWSKAVVGKFYRPVKEPVTIRLDSDILAWVRSAGPGYQTRINLLLRKIMIGENVKSVHGEQVEVSGRLEVNCAALREPSFPSLERHGLLERCNAMAARIVSRHSLFEAVP
jgi:uncharacterized protein (DUF4415 family)